MQPQVAKPNHAVNYYTILQLSQPRNGNSDLIPLDQLKTAYHRALLRYHPDKALQSQTSPITTREASSNGAQYHIDEIMRAYQILADPKLKREYDNKLSLNNFQSKTLVPEASQKGTHLGMESYDLEDLDYDETQGLWYRACRCGNEKGYTVTEDELEKGSTEGEIHAGCHGCSLFIKVLFSLVEDGDTA